MKSTYLHTFLCLAFCMFLEPGCLDINDVIHKEAKISVYVHWGDNPIQGKKVELIQSGEVKLTNENGLAQFTVSAGTYTIRVYGINRGGPSLLTLDFEVDVKPSESKELDVVDCLPCV